MPDFSELFMESDGQPVEYKGRTLLMIDYFPVPKGEQRIRYRIVSTNSEWKQGIAVSTEGELDFDEGAPLTRGWADLWEHLTTGEGEFTCRSRDGKLKTINIWDTGDGCVESWYYGAAMWVEEIPNGRRYHCNDGHPDDNFDDIVFELTCVD